MFQNLLPQYVLKIYSARNVNYRFLVHTDNKFRIQSESSNCSILLRGYIPRETMHETFVQLFNYDNENFISVNVRTNEENTTLLPL